MPRRFGAYRLRALPARRLRAYYDQLGLSGSLPSGQVGVAYSATATGVGGTAPYSYAVTAGALPAGLALDAGTGAVTGTPTGVETAVFTVTVTDAGGRTGARSFGVPVIFLPSSLAGLSLWLTAGPAYCFQDAAATVPCGDGDSVYTWLDRSPNGNHLVQATASSRPILYSLGGGLWCVTGDGVDDFMTTAAFAFDDSYSAAVVVARPWTAAKYATVFGHGYANDGSAGAAILTAGSVAQDWATGDLLAFGDGFASGRAPRAFGPSGGYADASMHVVAATLGASETRLRVDGASIATTATTGAGDTASAALQILRSSAILGDYGDWDLSESVIYSPALTLAQLQQVESYLNGVYGVY